MGPIAMMQPDDRLGPATVAALRGHASDSGTVGWQPIATAPRDGPVLVWDYHGMVAAIYNPLDGKWWLDLPYRFEAGIPKLELEPTHWMPLPAPPEGPAA